MVGCRGLFLVGGWMGAPCSGHGTVSIDLKEHDLKEQVHKYCYRAAPLSCENPQRHGLGAAQAGTVTLTLLCGMLPPQCIGDVLRLALWL